MYNTFRMSIPLLSTKFYIPPTRALAVARPHLVEKLALIVNQPGSIGLLSGAAGIGKTTLLSELTSQHQDLVTWLSLDGADNDPTHFWTYYISACQKVHKEVDETALASLDRLTLAI
jgi:LuxR family transcriptional regulator, maltose regulon positive regulatory protein